ncbi:IS3 family transposase [Paenibacillus sp. 19GGS1-52]|uniref:IS3 family transposase n=1 Tax=Paenibacillus sp. 19GGS1-52 TaxID=2758563 RepID=UPI001EFA32F0|nr:IS3 family transposase [Paenibacillus sp. 19GGS1-52]
MEEHRSEFRIEKMCSLLEVSRSGYYKWRLSPPSDRKMHRERLLKRIEYHFYDNDEIYGSPKITKKLQEEGFVVGEKTVGRIMRENKLRSQATGKFKVQTTDSNHDFPIAPNWLNQHFDVCTMPNQVWVTDITYIHTRQGVLYLASVLDLYTRKIVGWELGNRMKVDLVSVALEKAYKSQQPEKGLIHHSDRGSQYASTDYRKKLKEYHMIRSMSRRGNCYDNACIESFHSILKRELVYRRRFLTKEEAKNHLFRYIEFFYNRKRIHSKLDYLSPDRFESLYYKNLKFAN